MKPLSLFDKVLVSVLFVFPLVVLISMWWVR